MKKDTLQTDVYFRFKDYDQTFTPASSGILFPPEIYQSITKHLGGIILDIGTGDGYKLENLLLKCDPHTIKKIIAIDPSPLYKVARERFINYDYIEVKNVSLEDFESDYSFDVILFFEVIEHCPNPEEVMRKIVSLLKPSGILIMSTPNRPVYDFMEKLVKGKIDPTHISEMSVGKFKRFVSHFFDKVKITGILPIMKIGRSVPFLLKIHRFIAFPVFYNIVVCFARNPKKKWLSP